MFHPLFKTLLSSPQLLVEHLAGYAQLAGAQASDSLRHLKSRTLYLAIAGLLGLIGLMLVAAALMFVAAIPVDEMPAPWALAALPGVFLVASGLCAWLGMRKVPDFRFQAVREQWAIDQALLSRMVARDA